LLPQFRPQISTNVGAIGKRGKKQPSNGFPTEMDLGSNYHESGDKKILCLQEFGQI